MTWTPGSIVLASNFQNNVAKPLDAKQVVEDNVDLNTLTAPYDGLIVHVKNTGETHVCIDAANAGTGVSDPGGVINVAVWKGVGSGGGAWTDNSGTLHPTGSSGAQDVIIGNTTAVNADIVLKADGAAVFNEQGADVDFRVEGDTNPNALFVEGSSDQVGIGTGTPTFHLDVHEPTANQPSGIVVTNAFNTAGLTFLAGGGPSDGTYGSDTFVANFGTGKLLFGADIGGNGGLGLQLAPNSGSIDVGMGSKGSVSDVPQGTLDIGDGALYMDERPSPPTVAANSGAIYVKDVSGTSTPFFKDNATETNLLAFGDVTGPGSSVAGNLAAFDGTTGKLLKDGGVVVADLVTPAKATGDAYFQFNGGLTDSTGGTAGTIGGTNGTQSYPTYGGLSSDFGTQILFDNTGVSNGKYFKYPDPQLAINDPFTIEFFYNTGVPHSTDANQNFVGMDFDIDGNGHSKHLWACDLKTLSGNKVFGITLVQGELSDPAYTYEWIQFSYDWSLRPNDMTHFALMREDDGRTWHCWANGEYLALYSSSTSSRTLQHSYNFASASVDWALGVGSDGPTDPNTKIYFDNLRVTKSAIYLSDVGSGLAIPSAPSGEEIAISSGGTGQKSRQAALDSMTGGGTTGQVLTWDGSNAGWATSVSGDVTGPSSSTDNHIVTFDAGTGKVIQDSGTLISGLATSSHTHASSDLSSVVPISLGGTGAATQPAALDAITGAGTTGQVLTWDGANAGWDDAAGGSDVVLLPDQSSDPALAANTTKLYSADEVDSSPDFLYLLNEASGTAAVDSGQLGVDGVKAGGVGITASGIVTGTFGNCAVFDGVDDSISVGAVAGAPFCFNSDSSGRGDFELVFRVKPDALDKTYSLLSTNPTPVSNATSGHYAVLFVSTAGAGNGTIVFEYAIGGAANISTWSIPGTVSITANYHLVISFMTDVNTYAGSSAGVGKLRCYLDGVALDDAANSGTKEIAATMSDVGKNTSVPIPALFHFNDNFVDDGGGASAIATGTIPFQEPVNDPANLWPSPMGKAIRFTSPAGQVPTNYVTIPDPGVGAGVFTIECMFCTYTYGSNGGVIFSNMDGSDPRLNKFWIEFESNTALKVHIFDSSGNETTLRFANGNSWLGFYEYIYNSPPVHLAFVRSVSSGVATWRCYVNGILIPQTNGGTPNVTNFNGSTWKLGWGQIDSSSASVVRGLEGNTFTYDELRISKSDNIWTAGQNFTPPTTPHTAPPPYFPLNLGQYLDGVTSVGVGEKTLCHFGGSLVAAAGATLTTRGSGGTITYPTQGGLAATFGQQIRIQNGTPWGGTSLRIPDPLVGTGEFTFEFFTYAPSHPTAIQYAPMACGGGGLSGGYGAGWWVVWQTTTSLWFRWVENSSSYADIIFAVPNGASWAGSWHHVVIMRSPPSGGTTTWHMWADGAYLSTGQSRTAQANAFQAIDWGLGVGGAQGTNQARDDVYYDELRVTDTAVYQSNIGSTITVPNAPFDDPIASSTRFFNGQLDEFAVYNDRCLHDTNDTFQVPAEPIRATALSVPTILDSEGTKSKLLTTSNAGLLLPKSIEGLSDGSPWNDGGTVRIAPSVGPGVTEISLGGTGQITRQAALDALTGTGTATHVLTHDGTNAGWAAASGGGGGSGDVTGPSSSTDNHIVTFDGNTGKIIQDSTKLLSDYSLSGHNHSGVYAPNSHTHASSDLSSAVPLTLGGTGATTRAAALNAITGTGTTGHVLTWDGTNADWAASAGGGGATFTASGTAPGSPALGDHWYDTTNNILYVRVEDSASTDLWLDISTAGGAGIWNATPELASLDGVVAVKKQTAAPSGTADYAKVYSKTTTTPATTAEVIFHLDGDLQDSSLNANHGTANTTVPIVYENDSIAPGHSPSSSFGQYAFLDGAATTGGDADFTCGEIDIGTGSYTVEAWVKLPRFSSQGNCIASVDTGTNWLAGYMSVIIDQTNINVFEFDGSTSFQVLTATTTAAGMYQDTYHQRIDQWFHLAYVRDASTSTASLYVGRPGQLLGKRIAHNASYTNSNGIGGGGYDWVFGRLRNGTYTTYNFNGGMREILVAKEARYSGTTYTVPTAPYSATSVTTAKLYAMDSAGNEFQITP